MAPEQQKMMKMMSVVLMPITTGVALFMPAGLTVYFVISSFLHTAQQWFMHQPWFRRWVGLKPLAMPPASGAMAWQAPRVVDANAPRVTQLQAGAAPRSETMFESLKSTYADAKEKLNQRADSGVTERSMKAAREYEEKRALEEKERILARLHEKRTKNERF
jgi:YidC/Oxa1 family membrane protein insertase